MAVSKTLEVRLLGEFCVMLGGQAVLGEKWRRRKAAALIKLLALAPNHRLHREQLCEALWPEFDLAKASGNLRIALYHAHQRLAEAGGARNEFLVRDGGFIVLGPTDAVTVNVDAFVRAAAVAASTNEPTVIEAALALYSGDLLPDAAFEEWGEELEGRRSSLRDSFLNLLRQHAEISIKAGQHAAAIAVLERLLQTEPTDEAARFRLMRQLARTGQRQRALAQYDQFEVVLQREVGAVPPPALTRLRDDIATGRFPPPQQASTATRANPAVSVPTPLPSPVNRLIGREREAAEVRQLLASERLVTLSGTGGVGKTRLALAIGQDVATTFPDGVSFVDLAPVRDPALVVPTIAHAVGIREESQTPLRVTLMAGLRQRHQLLLIDNFEHVVEAAPEVAELLAAAPGLKVLVTSRTRLRLSGEHVYPVGPLALPASQPGRRPKQPLEQIASHAAVALFVERARAARPSFRLTIDNAEDVVAVCRRLDGLPLAIGLAAALVRVLPPAALRARLEAPGGSSLTLLPFGSQDAPERQQTLHGLIAWSYGLLSPQQRTLFERLSVFAGSWTLDAVDAVANLEADPAFQSFAALDELIDQGLVIEAGSTYDVTNGETLRFGMLGTIREFAEERLSSRGEGEEVRRRHAQMYTDLTERASGQLGGGEQHVWLDLLEREHGNLRVALTWSLEAGESNLAERLAGLLARFWYMRGHWNEGRRWLGQVLETVSKTPTLDRARALLGAGVLTEAQGQPDLALVLYEDARAAFSALDHQPGLCHVLNNLGNALDSLDHPLESVEHYEQALAVCQAAAETQGVAHALQNLGIVAALRGESETAAEMLGQSLALQRKLGDRFGVSETLANLGSLTFREGHLERAREIHTEVLTLTRELGDQPGEASAILSLGEVSLQAGDLQDAEPLFQEALILFQELGDPGSEASSKAGLGVVALRRDRNHNQALRLLREALIGFQEIGDQEQASWCLDELANIHADAKLWTQAARLLGAADSLRRSINVPLAPVYRTQQERTIAMVDAALDPDVFQAEWEVGASNPLTKLVSSNSVVDLGWSSGFSAYMNQEHLLS